MKPYLIALAAGLLVGIIYGLLNVRSPAPPVIALVGLLGILLGEQVVPLAKRLVGGEPVTLSSVREDSGHHIFGPLPHRSLVGHQPAVSPKASSGGPQAEDTRA